MSRFSESIVEEAAIEWFKELDYCSLPGPEIAPAVLVLYTPAAGGAAVYGVSSELDSFGSEAFGHQPP